MTVFHLDIEAFVTAVEQVNDPSLRVRPLVIAAPAARATVQAASPCAKKLGIVRGMPMSQVRERFKGIHIAPPNHRLYAKANRCIVNEAHKLSPTVEPIGYGHIVLDMRGTERLHGSLASAALTLCREVGMQMRLQGTVGIAANKLVSGIVAKEVQKHGELLHQVVPGDEQTFLAPLPCRALPEWQQQDVRRALFELNLLRIGDVQVLPKDLLSFAVGQLGPQLQRHAMGIDDTPVTPPRRVEKLDVKHVFLPDSNDDRVIQATLYRMLERVCACLRSKSLGTEWLKVALRYTDDVWRHRRIRVPLTQCETELYESLEQHYHRLCDRRIRVRFIHLTLEGLAPYYKQVSLFDPQPQSNLQRHLDRIRQRFGATAIQLGRGFAGQTLRAS